MNKNTGITQRDVYQIATLNELSGEWEPMINESFPMTELYAAKNRITNVRSWNPDKKFRVEILIETCTRTVVPLEAI